MPIGQTMTETIARAETAIRAAAPVAAADPLRPVFHFHAPANWMNDICGALWHEGWYHIFYQFNPFADRCDWSCVHACWGHARSRDLVHWEHLPIAVAPSVEEGNYQCASGCATQRADGTPMLFYGHTPLPRPDGTRPSRRQWAALPLDPELRAWRTLDIGLAPGKSGVAADIAGCWTDMFVFREAGRTFAIFKEADGLVVEAQTPELTRWQAVGPLTLNGDAHRIQGGTGDTLEVMAEFELDAADDVELALCDEASADAVRICYDGGALDANGTILPRVLSDDPRRLKLHLFYDKSVMELFVDDGLQTVTRVAIPPAPDLHLEAGATGGTATLRSLTIWPIKPREVY